MRIPEQKIEEILNSSDIVDSIGQNVQLRKRGKNYIGLCPFHKEKTPSFTVSPDKQIYYCFGCHEGGNVFKFLMSYKKISYVEAIQELADELGIVIHYDQHQQNGEVSETELLYDLNETAARFYSDNLLKNASGDRAKKYFDSRKINLQTLRSFGLGYAQNSRDALSNHIMDKKIDINRAIEIGLLGTSEKGRLYDRFSNRLIFPIFSPNGRVIAFAGRVFEQTEGTAKYLNSPESKIYYKGRVLYGLFHSKEEIRKLDYALIVEGYMDLISLHQNGIKNVVAVSGTALTDEQVQLLSRYTKNVVLLFDADQAGVNASMRSVEILLKQDMNIKIASLPKGEDPDSYVQKFGKDEFINEMNHAVNFLEFQFSIYESQGKLADVVSSTKTIRELIKPIALINDELKRSMLIKSLAAKFNLREKLIESETNKIISGSQKDRQQRHSSNEVIPPKLLLDERIAKREKEIKPLIRFEKELIQFMLEGNVKIIEYIFQQVEVDEFILDEHLKLAEIIFNAFNNGENINVNVLLSKIDDEILQRYCLEISVEKYRISDKWEALNVSEKQKSTLKHIKDVIKGLKIFHLDQKIKENFKLLQDCTEELKIQLMKENNELSSHRKMIEREYS